MRHLWFFILFILPFSLISNDQYNDLTTAEVTIIIDSLESKLESGNAASTDDKTRLIFDLAFLYSRIDSDKAIDYSLTYIELPDDVVTANKKYAVYRLLSDIYFAEGNFEKSSFFLNEQLSLADKKFHESIADVNKKYLQAEKDKVSLLGLNLFQIIFAVILLAMIAAIIFLWVRISSLHKDVIVKNLELENANTKFNEFKLVVDNAVKSSTKLQDAELEESRKSLVELRKSLKKVEESSYLKNAFLGNMSHQIRTPLSGILGFSEMLETELAVMGNKDLYEFAKSIHESGTKLMSLIANVIDISSIEANILELDINDIDINTLIGEVETGYLLKAKERGLVFKTKFDTDIKTIKADKVNLLKVLNIVADNAVNYSLSGFVTISTELNPDQTASVKIKDSGRGISKDELIKLERSFDFSRKGTSLTYTGQGLGLILAHRLCSLMNGSLNILSKEDEGTEVTIILPCEDEYKGIMQEGFQRQKPSILNAPDLGVVKIFIVEDDRMNRMVIEKMLKNTGYVTLAVDGDDAIAKLNKSVKTKNIYDVVLMDINLPAPWDGIKLMNYVKENIVEYKRIPFIAQTAYAFAGDEEQYLEAGFDEYVSKPLNKNVLLSKIQRLLEVSREA